MSNFTMNRRRFIIGSAAMSGVAATHSFIGVTAGLAQDVAKVRMQLGWLASNGILGEVAAIKQGFFAEEGVELEIVPGGPSIDGVAGVAAGQSQLGMTSSSPAIMLAREVVPAAELDAAVQRWVDEVVACAPLSLRAIKQTVNRTAHLPPAEAQALRTPALIAALVSEDAEEGVRAFQEKRAPVWFGR